MYKGNKAATQWFVSANSSFVMCVVRNGCQIISPMVIKLALNLSRSKYWMSKRKKEKKILNNISKQFNPKRQNLIVTISNRRGYKKLKNRN